MSFAARFLDLMPATVTITPFRRPSTDGYGGPQFSTKGTTYRARVTFARQMDFVAQGQSVTPTHVAWVATTQDFDPRSQFKYQGTTYRILNVVREMDDKVLHHTKMLLKGG
jgi:SPP1 family predicted phage head-tail adaptor